MTAIQAVYVRGHEERPNPKLHVVYRIEIQAHVRSWQMWRRYSEFAELHTELTKSTGSPPPAGPFRDESTMIEQRRAAAKEEKWRESFAFRDFLGVPVGKQGSIAEGSSKTKVLHLELQSRIRDVRADINRRDTLSNSGDVGASHTANSFLSRVRTLTEGLQELGLSGMAEGELQRRTDMVARLQDDCEKLGRMVTVARQVSRVGGSPAPGFTNVAVAPESDRAALFGSGRPVTRVFGAASKKPQETAATRPLDDTGLLRLQKVQMEHQDTQLSQLTSILQRQRHLGEAIGAELAVHNEMLDQLNVDVDRVGGKLTSAKKQLNRLG
ncbi:hypothetical protein BU15DRAFT_86674 [Melanogaster broomeanus]|nr:hypothetical protein BU15DRAFT_86674 [Melanogaster broomeanus]